MASTHLHLGFGDGVPTGDCVTMGSHQANFNHAFEQMTKVAATGGQIVTRFDPDPAWTKVEWLVNGTRVAFWDFS